MTNIDRALSGYRYVEILQDDTLQTIAARELKDASRWHDLITINGLTYPYLTGDPAQANSSVLLYGDLIVVPAAVTQVSTVADPNTVFKIDIGLTNGKLIDDGLGDFSVVAGRENYRQSIKHAIDTDTGELLYHLPYGCKVRTVLGTVNGPTAAQLSNEYVKSTVLADDRTDSVTSAQADVSGDTLEVSVSAVPITGTAVDIVTRT